ncbi:MAG: hypothetical protein GX304_06450 [Clostridiales bacterium]|jgi:uroporphyrinogen decarboxylase|nr:hypothetical protein [Clostridiales bacterium]
MNGRERFLTALINKKPDRLPCQVHNFMQYYLNTYMNGMDVYEAYDYVGMDPVIYEVPRLIYDEKDLKNWRYEYKSYRDEKEDIEIFTQIFHTPKGDLTVKGASNKFTAWNTDHLIKDEKDFEIFKDYYPVAIAADWSPVIKAKNKIGDRGIVRIANSAYGQPGTWQSLVYMMGMEQAIMKAVDDPDWVHYALNVICEKNERQIYNMGKIEADLVENGGGAASSTVISPSMYEEFCLPYDRRIHKAIKDNGALIVYHLCGGLMPLLEMVATNGADALETMTPSSMGGDCVMEEANERIGDKMCFIGGFDQNEGFERGNKKFIEEEVYRLFKAKNKGGYICSPSDHFFFGDVENLIYFTNVCKECRY